MGHEKITVQSALLGDECQPSGPVTIIIEDRLIAAIEPATGSVPQLLAMPSLTDAHNHARPLSTTSFGCALQPLESWLPNLAVMPAVDPYTAAAASFSRSLAGGCTSIMVHLTRPMAITSLAQEVCEIARAAKDVGVSIALAVAMRNRNPLIYGDHSASLNKLSDAARHVAENTWLAPTPSIQDQLATVDAVADALAEYSDVDVQYGPNGVQWCSDEFLQAIAAASEQTGRRIHMHLLETSPQRQWADHAYPDGVVNHLSNIGLLSERTTLAHCVWARSEELEIIAAADARIAINASSNLHLSSGIAPVRDMLATGVTFAMGLDGCAFDEDDDGLRELRLFHWLNRSWGFSGSGLNTTMALEAACSNGRRGLGLDAGGVLKAGMPADILLLDLNTLDRDKLLSVDPRDYLFTRASRSHLVSIYSRGRKVMDEGRLTGVDIDTLHTSLRKQYLDKLPERAELIEFWPQVEAVIGEHYRVVARGGWYGQWIRKVSNA